MSGNVTRFDRMDRALCLTHIDRALLLVLDPKFREAAKMFLIWATQNDAPHTAMTRQYLRQRTSTLARPEVDYPRVEYAQVCEFLTSLVDQRAQEIRESI